MITERAFTREEAAKMLSISPRTIDAARIEGKLDYIKIGRAVRIPQEALRKFIQENLVSSQQANTK
jgi:excisionase family DNA binding protein